MQYVGLISTGIPFCFILLTGCQHKTGSSSAAFVDSHETVIHDSRKLDLTKSSQVYVDAQPIKPLVIPNLAAWLRAHYHRLEYSGRMFGPAWT